jgi:hypothetical protein
MSRGISTGAKAQPGPKEEEKELEEEDGGGAKGGAKAGVGGGLKLNLNISGGTNFNRRAGVNFGFKNLSQMIQGGFKAGANFNFGSGAGNSGNSRF